MQTSTGTVSYTQINDDEIQSEDIVKVRINPLAVSIDKDGDGEKSLSSVQLCDPMDCSLPGSSSMGFCRQEYWSGLPFPSPGDLPNPGIEPMSPIL